MLRFSLLILAFLFVFISGCADLSSIREGDYKSEVPITPSTQESGEIPSEVNLDVLFYSQAPFGNWGMPYQEACEEASLLLAYYYVTGKTVDINQFEKDLLAMVEWEKNYFGQYEHTTIEETGEMAEKHLDLKSYKILENPSVEDLKKELAQGHPIVAPFGGRYLGNPYYTGAGPVYHMLVIRGYDEKHFITNDVGTRRGENFIYTYETLMSALHDYHPSSETDPAGILQGAKKVLVLTPAQSL